MIAGIIGAAGYAGAELIRILSGHPKVKGFSLGSVSLEGGLIEQVYPNFLGAFSSPLVKPDEVIEKSDIIFSALPHAVGEPYAKACIDKGKTFIDLSADFRFDDDEATYTAWYSKAFAHPELRQRSVYGLPELNRSRIKALAASGPLIIANPGCYPTGASLGIYPSLAKGLAADGTIIVDSATGITGGGREPQKSFHFPEATDTVSPYKVGAHRHLPEISRVIKTMAKEGSGAAVDLIFTPHLAPMNRGILSTIYIPLKPQWQGLPGGDDPRPPTKETEAKEAEIRQCYQDFYKDEPFVRILPQGVFAATGRTRLSNYCDIAITLDQGGKILIVTTAIDNMVKGASGQAVQNMNIILGYQETEGLEFIPALF
ncbi:MAG: N-acetyl-gamma-glutamyl-phosphate reductase [Treponema sp.]|nr:N-acetyl-gamma-glutamyl-phosphate reductase [Treponema sp.]